MSKKRKLKYFYFEVLFWLAIIFLSFLIINKSVRNVVHMKREIVVPNIEKKSILEALSIVSKAGLTMKKIGETFDGSLPLGTVVLQHPSAGMVVREGRTVNVITSLGGQKDFVPNIIGEEKRFAEIKLHQYGLFIGSVTEVYSLRYAKNRVVYQNPQEGSIVEKNTYVDIKVSLGLPPEGIILVPDFVNKSYNEALDWGNKNNIKVLVKEVFVDSSKPDIVISQSLAPDEVVTSEQYLEVEVSKVSQDKLPERVSEVNFEYEIPPMGSVSKKVKIIQVSKDGEKVLYDNITSPGSKISLYVPQKESSRIRIFIDGVLIDEK